eukprot:6423429-Amphidinium_carterae.2
MLSLLSPTRAAKNLNFDKPVLASLRFVQTADDHAWRTTASKARDGWRSPEWPLTKDQAHQRELELKHRSEVFLQASRYVLADLITTDHRDVCH